MTRTLEGILRAAIAKLGDLERGAIGMCREELEEALYGVRVLLDPALNATLRVALELEPRREDARREDPPLGRAFRLGELVRLAGDRGGRVYEVAGAGKMESSTDPTRRFYWLKGIRGTVAHDRLRLVAQEDGDG